MTKWSKFCRVDVIVVFQSFSATVSSFQCSTKSHYEKWIPNRSMKRCRPSRCKLTSLTHSWWKLKLVNRWCTIPPFCVNMHPTLSQTVCLTQSGHLFKAFHQSKKERGIFFLRTAFGDQPALILESLVCVLRKTSTWVWVKLKNKSCNWNVDNAHECLKSFIEHRY